MGEIAAMPADKQPHIGRKMVVSLCIVLAGGVIYAGGLAQVTVVSIAVAIANLFFIAIDQIVHRRFLTTECKDLSTSVCVLLNNAFGVIPLVAMAMPMGDFQQL